jgi:SAM-dependent methyltransferase
MTTTVKSRVIRRMVRQFGNPRGMPGQLVGWILAHRSSNVRRNRWVAGVLDPAPTDRVLEVGFGPGIAIAAMASRVPRGRVYGIDHSAVMVAQASRRNRAAIRAGRVHLMHASVDRLPSFDEPLDTIFAVNSAQFWPEPAERLRDLKRLLRPGGRIALVLQPRVSGATAEHTARAARANEDLLTQAGFVQPRVEILDLDPPVACVLATNPG